MLLEEALADREDALLRLVKPGVGQLAPSMCETGHGHFRARHTDDDAPVSVFCYERYRTERDSRLAYARSW